MSGPSFKLRLPPASLFKFPPDANPAALPPPVNARTFASPFAINEKLYNGVLDWKVPVTIGAVYMTTAILMNKVNRDRKHVPFAFTKTAAFHYFVIAHNVFLAVFSALTFFGMIRALAHTWPGRRDLPLFGKYWPGLRTQNGLAGAADALCKLHGPRDLGDAVYFNPDKDTWETSNRNIKLAITRTPDASDVGRLWNEGLAFWGWWFYLSKFYEVLDTFIILAKGKRSSTLQTYHHTGAMACMWAGIRFMSPPIWMFCFLNSGIHTLMYTYYTLAALRIRVPQRIKRTLTTMQITQFLIGITFASLHLFVYYSVPVATPFTKTVGKAVSVGASAVSSVVSEAASKAPEVAAAAAPSIGAFIKKLLLRAAGEEGMAQRVADPQSFSDLLNSSPGSISDSKSHKYHNHHQNQNRTTSAWRTQYNYVPCIYTTGQAFAIWLNLFYLAPLTMLFTRFFVRSYTRRGIKSSKPSNPSGRIVDAAKDAAKETDRKIEKAGKAAEDSVEDIANRTADGIESANKKAKEATKGNKTKPTSTNESKSDKTNDRNDVTTKSKSESVGRSVSSSNQKASNTEQSQTAQTKPNKHDSGEEFTQKAADLGKKAEEKITEVAAQAKDKGSKAANTVADMAGKAKMKTEESMSSSKFSDGSFSMVDKKDLESSTVRDDQSKDPQKLLKKIEGHEAPTFAEVADPDESTHVGDEKPELQNRSDSSRSQESQRSSSPSKKSGKSKIPKIKSSNSPTKKVISAPKVTTSMSAHSGTAIVDKDDSTIGNA